MADTPDDPDEIAIVHDPEIESVDPWLSKAAARREMAAAGAPWADRYLARVAAQDAEAGRLTDLFVEGGDPWAIRVRLEALGTEYWPLALTERYRHAARREQRHDCVKSAIRTARDSRVAIDLGLMALRDRAYAVRWRAHQLLAYGLDRSVLPDLRQALAREPRAALKDSIAAAMRAIEMQDHNLFVDRNGTGRMGWGVNPWDCRDPAVQRGALNYTLCKIRDGWRTEI